MARAAGTGWVELICRLCVVWRSGETSIRELFGPALPHLDDRAAFIARVSRWLRDHPDLVDAWQVYCEDKRTGQSPYFGYSNGAWRVGFYDCSVNDIAGRYQDERVHTDPVDACADFIYREAAWCLRRERAG